MINAFYFGWYTIFESLVFMLSYVEEFLVPERSATYFVHYFDHFLVKFDQRGTDIKLYCVLKKKVLKLLEFDMAK